MSVAPSTDVEERMTSKPEGYNWPYEDISSCSHEGGSGTDQVLWRNGPKLGVIVHISELRIRNFRNSRTARFRFRRGVNTLIGENGSGKTNALYALRLLLD